MNLTPAVIEELRVLNVGGSPHRQLLRLGRLIQKSSSKYTENLVIIRKNRRKLFVVLFKMNGNEWLDLADESSPFIVCPVTDIRKITHAGGICYGEDSSWIRWPWPDTATGENEYAIWLHDQLIEISDVYKKRSPIQINEMIDIYSFHEAIVKYEQRLRDEPYKKPQRYKRGRALTRLDLVYSVKPLAVNTTTANNSLLPVLIHEENNRQHFKVERQSTTQYWNNPSAPVTPATAEFIAQFRLDHEHEHNQQVVNADMRKKKIKCTICLKKLKTNNSYARWPCPDAHLFHYKCMLKSLRERNTCPFCRHEVTSIPAISLYGILA
ncbi:unnamed protein product [Adineta steineri]|uniref:RING-type domain-containing protein n=1 Tax=Adineta steineri TaxID=433720 RepID=A0A813VS61_9BILA|nr:unnamed protein product [Adineta steineri]CAF3799460.1 unnamed protein product [Adineta steineri]